MRDIVKTIEKHYFNIPDKYDLTVEEVQAIMEHSRGKSDLDTQLNMIYAAFIAGFILGSKATAKGKFNAPKMEKAEGR